MVLLQSEVDIAVIGSGWSTKARDHQCLPACKSRHEGKGARKGDVDGYAIPPIPHQRQPAGILGINLKVSRARRSNVGNRAAV